MTSPANIQLRAVEKPCPARATQPASRLFKLETRNKKRETPAKAGNQGKSSLLKVNQGKNQQTPRKRLNPGLPRRSFRAKAGESGKIPT
jgi:hypothetical protein